LFHSSASVSRRVQAKTTPARPALGLGDASPHGLLAVDAADQSPKLICCCSKRPRWSLSRWRCHAARRDGRSAKIRVRSGLRPAGAGRDAGFPAWRVWPWAAGPLV